MDGFWEALEQCADRLVAEGATVEDVIRICHEYFGKSAGDAFFPSGSGDRDVYGILALERSDWTIVWSEADYYFCARDSQGDLLSFIEGDIQRGNCKSRSKV